MEELNIPLSLLQKALQTFGKSFDVVTKATNLKDEELILATQDSCIQRFEYCFDSFWKFSKRYLEQVRNMQNLNSPRAAFSALLNQNIISAKEGETLLAMLIDRNETTHNYDAQQVREIFPNLKNYYILMESILERLPNNGEKI